MCLGLTAGRCPRGPSPPRPSLSCFALPLAESLSVRLGGVALPSYLADPGHRARLQWCAPCRRCSVPGVLRLPAASARWHSLQVCSGFPREGAVMQLVAASHVAAGHVGRGHGAGWPGIRWPGLGPHSQGLWEEGKATPPSLADGDTAGARAKQESTWPLSPWSGLPHGPRVLLATADTWQSLHLPPPPPTQPRPGLLH